MRVDAGASFCPHCGTQVRVQPLEGEVVSEGRSAGVRVRAPDPLLAAALSIVPGLGHWYAGAPVRGLVYFLGIAGAEVLGVDLDLSVIGAAVGIPLELGGLALWAHCVFDAFRTARRKANQTE